MTFHHLKNQQLQVAPNDLSSFLLSLHKLGALLLRDLDTAKKQSKHLSGGMSNLSALRSRSQLPYHVRSLSELLRSDALLWGEL
jgi:hypothetical protein